MTVNLPILLCLFHVALLCVFTKDWVQMTRIQRKHKSSVSTKPRKRQNKAKEKGKVKPVNPGSDSEFGIRVTAESMKRCGGGILDDEIIHKIDLMDSRHTSRSEFDAKWIDGQILAGVTSCDCQDSFTGPTGARAEHDLANVIILDNDSDIPVPCRHSILTCSGCYKWTLAAADFLDDCKHWDATNAPHVLISGPIMDTKTAEAESVAAVASVFYRGVKDSFCKGKFLDANDICRGQAILCKFAAGKQGAWARPILWVVPSGNTVTLNSCQNATALQRKTKIVELEVLPLPL
ncbi:hypothetical protein C8R43DRAFT_962359 [Mycena crocata]|nr:hypothetical protein C8R43DRAFT_962359 [Mycena crocata]